MEIADLNLPVKVSDAINSGLSAVGISLPLAATQGFVLVLGLAALSYGIRTLRQKGITDLQGLLVTIGFGLFSAGVLYGWVESTVAPVTGQLAGNVVFVGARPASGFMEVRVSVLDLKGQPVSRESGAVDSESGFFALSYPKSFGDWPRTLRVKAADCKDQDIPLTRARLRAGTPLEVSFTCGGKP